MGFDESVETAKIGEWRLVVDMLVGELVTLVTDGSLVKMIHAWAMIFGGKDWEVARPVSLRVVG